MLAKGRRAGRGGGGGGAGGRAADRVRSLACGAGRVGWCGQQCLTLSFKHIFGLNLLATINLYMMMPTQACGLSCLVTLFCATVQANSVCSTRAQPGRGRGSGVGSPPSCCCVCGQAVGSRPSWCPSGAPTRRRLGRSRARSAGSPAHVEQHRSHYSIKYLHYKILCITLDWPMAYNRIVYYVINTRPPRKHPTHRRSTRAKPHSLKGEGSRDRPGRRCRW